MIVELVDLPVGAFAAFVDPNDSHSPILYAPYSDLVKSFDDQISLFYVDTSDPLNAPFLDQYRVYSTPTFLWLYPTPQAFPNSFAVPDTDPPISILVRLMGTVLPRKLLAECELALNRLDL